MISPIDSAYMHSPKSFYRDILKLFLRKTVRCNSLSSFFVATVEFVCLGLCDKESILVYFKSFLSKLIAKTTSRAETLLVVLALI